MSLFDAIARRSGQPLSALSEAIQNHKAGQTGLLRLCWDNGDRTVIGNPLLGGITLGWNLMHTAADELFAKLYHELRRLARSRLASGGRRMRCIHRHSGPPGRSGHRR